jgi:fluoride exporter
MMLIGIGAGLGAWLRWQITSFWKKRGINWPVATLLINLAGTLLLGYLIH